MYYKKTYVYLQWTVSNFRERVKYREKDRTYSRYRLESRGTNLLTENEIAQNDFMAKWSLTYTFNLEFSRVYFYILRFFPFSFLTLSSCYLWRVSLVAIAGIQFPARDRTIWRSCAKIL